MTGHLEITTLSTGNRHSQPMVLTTGPTRQRPGDPGRWRSHLDAAPVAEWDDHPTYRLGSCNMAIEDCHLYPFMVDFPMKKCDLPYSYVNDYQRVP